MSEELEQLKKIFPELMKLWVQDPTLQALVKKGMATHLLGKMLEADAFNKKSIDYLSDISIQLAEKINDAFNPKGED